jgi:rRNA maturation RNase YbeY
MIFFWVWETHFNFFYKKLLFSWIYSLINHEKVILGEINYIYCNDEYLLMMNNKYLNHNFYTDIITFNYVKKSNISGDIFISLDRIKENALKWGVSFEKELYRVMIHGILHLLSYKDKYHTDKFIMKDKENFYLDLLFFKLKKCFMI